jgi:acetate kinase
MTLLQNFHSTTSPVHLLTVNSGSTSTRLALFEATQTGLSAVARERYSGATPRQALVSFASQLAGRAIDAVAHRVVHGGTRFTQPVIIDSDVLAAITANSELAPLHNPPALDGIAAARERCDRQAVHVAVFDTAFFARLPRVAAEYAVAATVADAHGVRRYGFHGIAHEAMWQRWCALTPDGAAIGRLITLQLGGGCSIAAIDRGQPIDTSMGFSPLEGLVMATRAGDIDAAVVPYLAARLGRGAHEIVEMLNRQSGLLGVAGRDGDPSALLAEGSEQSRFAVELYCYRARKYVGAYLAVLGGCDGLVFGGGVGEHVPEVREMILRGMEWAGIGLDAQANSSARSGEAVIGAADSAAGIYVIPADEELALARAALGCLHATESGTCRKIPAS